MSTPFVEISSVEALEEFLANANGSAVVLFKHSSTCGVSGRAFNEMSKLRQPIGLITVQQARAVSNEIETRWQLDHETPQVLIVRNGELAWDASHFNVKAEAVQAALESEGRP